MKLGNIYLVRYKQYYNDTEFMEVKVFAHTSKECEEKVKESGLIYRPINAYSPNMGYIDSIKLVESEIL